jgi:CPA1 family monovalent cation:H+ antiporter
VSGRETALLVLVLMLAALLLARRVRTPAPVVLAIVGLAAGSTWRLVPGLPPVRMPPDLVLFAFLPPLLTAAAYSLPPRAFRRNLLPIGLLAVGLVLATTVSVAAVARATAGLPWAAALVLGATVAPPDPVAATSIAERTGLAHRLVLILEGEGLVNDAVAISLYGLAVHAAVTGDFSWGHAVRALVRDAPTGVAVGLAVGWLAAALRRRVSDAGFEVGSSLLVPYLTYQVALRVGGSGVLACVALGMLLRHYDPGLSTPAVQLAERTVWSAVRFVSTALVFLLVGLLVGEIAVPGLQRTPLAAGAAVAGTAVAVRMAWMYGLPHLARALGYGGPVPSWRELTVLGWSGMRGVVSLALALAVPPGLGAGGGVRHIIISLTFAVIVATLVLQGVALMPLVHALHAGDPGRPERDERRARSRARRRGVIALRRALRDAPPDEARFRSLLHRVETGEIGIARSGSIGPRVADSGPLLRAIEAQRDEVERLRDEGRIGRPLAERLINELEVDAMSVRGRSADLTGG